MKAQQPFPNRRAPLNANIRHILVSDGGENFEISNYNGGENDIKDSFAKKLSVLGKKGDENDFKNETFGDHLKNKDAENSDNVSSLKLLADRTRKFCSESSLHVIKYVADLNRHFLERAFWAIMFFLSLCASVPSISQAWNKFNDDSLAVGLHQTAEPVWKIPFPEVIICNEAIVHGDFLKQQKLDANTSAELSLFCPNLLPPNGSKVISEEELYSFAEKHHVPITEFVLEHSYEKSRAINITKYFKPRFSDFGLCFSFNALPYNEIFTSEKLFSLGSISFEEKEEAVHEWDLERGYLNSWYKQNPTPRRMLSNGFTNSYIVALRRKKHFIYPPCSSPNAGFKVSVKNPADGMTRLGDFMRLSMGRETNILLTPKLVTTENSTRSIPPAARECFFQDERKLFFFKFYTQKNCQAECTANITLATCNCVAFHMPRGNDTKICFGTIDRRCVELVAEKIEIDMVKGTLHTGDEIKKWRPCGCLPSCTYLSYSFEVFNGDLMAADEDFAFLAIYFKENEFFPLVRVKQYDFLTFISTCGGLLGLFLGFSLLSLVEVLYFLVILPVLKIMKEFC